MRRKNFLASLTTLAAAGFLMFAPAAHAATLEHFVFGASTQNIETTATGNGGFTLQLGTGSPYTLSGPAIITQDGEQGVLGAYSISSSRGGTFTPTPVGTLWSTSNFSSELTMTDPSGFNLTVPIVWTTFKDHSSTPVLYGMTTINDAVYLVDLTLNLVAPLGGHYFDTWLLQATGGDSIQGPISSGELDASPEPVSLGLMILGFAIIGVAILKRRKTLGEGRLPLAA